MKVFLCDMKRALISWRSLAAMLAVILVLLLQGAVSDLFRVSVPLLCTLPYTTAWLNEYSNSYVRYSLCRSGREKYIFSKFFACAAAGGLVEALGALIYVLIKTGELSFIIIVDMELGCNIWLLLMSGMLWASLSALLAAVTNSRYIAYGGAFIINYFLVILKERYFTGAYYLNPARWYAPEVMTGGYLPETAAFISAAVIAGLCAAYYFVLRGKLKNV